jgi:hypothetical protein
MAGTVASAIRYLAKAILGGGVCGSFTTNSDIPKLQGNLLSERGLGERAIESNKKNVRLYSLAGLTQGGDRRSLDFKEYNNKNDILFEKPAA